jgi:Restriction endonuclease
MGFIKNMPKSKKSMFRIPPQSGQKKDAIIRVVKQIPCPFPELCWKISISISRQWRIPDISGEQYQHGDLLYHKNFKQACLVRDKFRCRVCGAQTKLQCHHIRPRAKGGTDKLSNLMTLCDVCHDRHHKEGLKLPKQKSSFYMSAAHVQQGKHYLQRELSKTAQLSTTFGYITGHHRNRAEIEKSHVNDAVVIADKNAIPFDGYIKTNHVQYRKRSLHESTARKGRKSPNRTQKRNNKNVFTLKGFTRGIRYSTRDVSVLSPVLPAVHPADHRYSWGIYQKSGKKYTQVNLREVRKIHGNRSTVRYYGNSSPTES